ncbi:hypothetical protein, partial [Bacteroides fragilis]
MKISLVTVTFNSAKTL